VVRGPLSDGRHCPSACDSGGCINVAGCLRRARASCGMHLWPAQGYPAPLGHQFNPSACSPRQKDARISVTSCGNAYELTGVFIFFISDYSYFKLLLANTYKRGPKALQKDCRHIIHELALGCEPVHRWFPRHVRRSERSSIDRRQWPGQRRLRPL
jgi:hypothetical protein